MTSVFLGSRKIFLMHVCWHSLRALAFLSDLPSALAPYNMKVITLTQHSSSTNALFSFKDRTARCNGEYPSSLSVLIMSAPPSRRI